LMGLCSKRRSSRRPPRCSLDSTVVWRGCGRTCFHRRRRHRACSKRPLGLSQRCRCALLPAPVTEGIPYHGESPSESTLGRASGWLPAWGLRPAAAACLPPGALRRVTIQIVDNV
jgi:hypothetical protein